MSGSSHTWEKHTSDPGAVVLLASEGLSGQTLLQASAT